MIMKWKGFRVFERVQGVRVQGVRVRGSGNARNVEVAAQNADFTRYADATIRNIIFPEP
jgi:hypothetical protein